MVCASMGTRPQTRSPSVVVRYGITRTTSSCDGGIPIPISPKRDIYYPGSFGASVSVGLSHDDIRLLLDDLSAELATRGARADLFLVGGAAIAIAYDKTRSTRDLDAVFLPTNVVRQSALAVAEKVNCGSHG